MIIPKNIIIFAIVLLPASALAPYENSFLLFLVGIVLFLIIISFLEILILINRTKNISINLKETSRFSLGRESNLEFKINNPDKSKLEAKIVPLIPLELGTVHDELILTIPQVETSVFNNKCKPNKRGVFKINSCVVEFTTLLKFWSFKKKFELEGEARVYPNLRKERRSLAAVLLNRPVTGSHIHSSPGLGREFEKLREYVSGDSYDQISWKATAKRGRPICKEFRVERAREVYVIIDTSRMSSKKTGDNSVIENYISSALALGLITEKQGDLFGVLAFDDHVRKFVRARSGKPHFSSCREAIFELQPQPKFPDFSALFSFIRLHIRRRSLLIFLTDLDNPGIAEPFVSNIQMISKQHLCFIAMVTDKKIKPLFKEKVETTTEIYSHLASHINWSELLNVQAELQKSGAHLSIMNHEKLSVELINKYLNIKKRQLI